MSQFPCQIVEPRDFSCDGFDKFGWGLHCEKPGGHKGDHAISEHTIWHYDAGFTIPCHNIVGC